MDTRWPGLRSWSWGLGLLVQILLARVTQAGLTMSYCSPDLNSGSYTAMTSEYQSTGLCGNNCQGSYAFAIIQGYDCWCSNYIPTDQVSTSECNEGCPGIDTEDCGSTSADLYSYYLLEDGVALGTSGGSDSSTAASTTTSTADATSTSTTSSSSSTTSEASTSTESTSTPSTTTTTTTTTTTPESVSSDTDTSTSSSSTSTASESTSSSSSSSSTTTQMKTMATSSSPSSSSSSSSVDTFTTSSTTPTQVYTSVMTVTGQAHTVVVTPSSATSSDAISQDSSGGGSGHGLNAGKIVGIVLGVVIGIGLIIGLLLWLWFRSRRQQHPQNGGLSPDGSFGADQRSGGKGSGPNSSGDNSIPSRQVSQMSTAGLLGKPPRLMTTGLNGQSSSDPRSAGTTGSGRDRRSQGTDQRLNPWALYSQEDRLSSISLQDNQDYSRQLRVANPD